MNYKYYIDEDNDSWRVSGEKYELFDDREDGDGWYEETYNVFEMYILRPKLKPLTEEEYFIEKI